MKNFVVYKASAGSGKTFTLVKEYLRLALHDEKRLNSNYRRILALTFTNKAAAEMKNRVISALSGISTDVKPGKVALLLSEELALSNMELTRRATLVLNHILHHYSDLSIGTIDSFNHKIVKTFAHDLQLPVNFTIELDTRGFYDRVISTLFSRIGEDAYVSKLLQEYALGKAADNVAWDPERNIREFSDLLHKEASGIYLEKLKQFDATELESFRKQFIDFIRHYKSTLHDEASSALALISKHGLQDEDFYYKGSGPQKFFQKCLEGTVNLADASGPRINEAVNSGNWAGKPRKGFEEVIQQIAPQLSHHARSLLNYVHENYSHFSLCQLLTKQMYPLMLLKKIEEISEDQKQEERLVFISEFNQKIFDIITNEPTPFIYERLGERYQHYLLDEFQDTSSLQWQNILPLIDNSLSNGWFNLVVGDGKQSIYRWRNANVKQFTALPKVENSKMNAFVEERALALERNFFGNSLLTNYRSNQQVVSFNNKLFDALSSTLLSSDDQLIYHQQAQLADNLNDGLVTVQCGTMSREELDAQTYAQVKEHIVAALASGYAYKDICILCRKNFQGNGIAKFLLTQSIPIISSDSLLLKNNMEINTLTCYLTYLVNQEDAISAAAVINYLFQTGQITKDDLHLHVKDLAHGTSLFQVLEKCGIHLKKDKLSLNNLFDVCVEFINAVNLTGSSFIYVRFFMDEVNEYLVNKNSNIPDFLAWWKRRSGTASLVIPENTDAVRIMTIHGSKGLEFPVVIVPYCNWGTYRAGDAWVHINNERIKLPVSVIELTKKAGDSGFEAEFEREKQEQLLDNLNLLYVAFTRAIERLHILSPTVGGSIGSAINEWISTYMYEHYTETREGYFEIGSLTPKTGGQHSKGLPTFALEPLRFSTPADVVRIKSSYLLNSEQTEHAKRKGLLVHWLLSMIHSPGDLDKAFSTAINTGEITSEEMPDLRNQVLAITEHPLLAPCFEKGLENKLEAELITREGEVLRPDRVTLTGKDTFLIDYKTGKEDVKKHAQQLAKYDLALRNLGVIPTKKYLVYVDELHVVEV